VAQQVFAVKIWHPYTQAALDPPPIRIERAEGAFLFTADGRQLIDAVSSWWVNIHGHSHPRIADAIAEQSRKLEHVIFAGFTHEPAEQLAAGLSQLLPQSLSHLFYSDNGSTAVEVALKMAVQYWRNAGRPQRAKFVALENAYHGDTAGAMSVSADSPFTNAFDSMRFPVFRGHSADCHHCPVGKSRAGCDIDCLERLRDILDRHHAEIAAIIVEPLVQGAAGMIIHPVEFLQRIRDLASHYDVLLIADEVFTGFGRTGAMFASGLAGIVPDIICLSKGLTGGFVPLAATVCTERIYSVFHAPDRARTFFHGHSYTANPIACAAAVASLKIFEDEPVFGRIAAIQTIHQERLLRIADHPAVDNVRWLGDIGVIELKAVDAGYLSTMRDRLYAFFIDRGVLLRPLGNVLYVLPPYVISPADLQRIYDVIGEAIESSIFTD
jgi:adenosylmethionine---8-amino-7-oxononanoate aminotransferase